MTSRRSFTSTAILLSLSSSWPTESLSLNKRQNHPITSLSHAPPPPSSAASSTPTFLMRRDFVTTSILGWATMSSPAAAIKERNEALCKTGFFTNIAAYYCTDLGNIADEGYGRSLSVSEENTMGSLMSKFDLSEGAGDSKDVDGKDEKEETMRRMDDEKGNAKRKQ
mmetsp:Transcript_18515/g.22981  ORF Transcript_18515/g.22981 Transcript_18515/m.22981 type:complete len:167 (+) Transcript_18515:88-588(+)